MHLHLVHYIAPQVLAKALDTTTIDSAIGLGSICCPPGECTCFKDELIIEEEER